MVLFKFFLYFSQKYKTTIEIKMPFDDMCDNFLLLILQKWTIANNILPTK